MDKITIDYKGYTLTYLDYNDSWKINGDDWKGSGTLVSQMAKIDKFEKGNFERFEVWTGDIRVGKFQVKTVTSIDDEGNYWLSHGKNNREKLSPKYIYKICDENMKIATDANALYVKASAISSEADALAGTIITITGKKQNEYESNLF